MPSRVRAATAPRAVRPPDSSTVQSRVSLCRLRWHRHELDPAWDPPLRSLNRYCQLDEIIARVAGFDGLVARLALEITPSVRCLTVRINDLERELTTSVNTLPRRCSPVPASPC
jgi:transposase